MERPGSAGSRRCGAAASPRPPDRALSPRLPRTAPRHRPQPVPAATSRCRAARTGQCHQGARQMRRSPTERPAHRAGTPRIVRDCPSGAKSAPAARRLLRKRRPLTSEASAAPAGLTARARPKARPEMSAANLTVTYRKDRRNHVCGRTIGQTIGEPPTRGRGWTSAHRRTRPHRVAPTRDGGPLRRTPPSRKRGSQRG